MSILLVLATATAAPTALAESHGVADMEVILADPSKGGASGRMAPLDVEIQANVVVRSDDAGTFVRMVMPQGHDANVQLAPLELEFFAPDDGATDGDYSVEQLDGGQSFAVFRWLRNAPPVGSNVSVTMEAGRDADLGDAVIILWPSHGFDNVTIRVDVPATHRLVGTMLTQQVHNVPAGRSVWTGADANPSSSVTLQPTVAVPDNAFDTYRPNPVGGWLIVVGLAVVSGGAWLLGKRLEPEMDEAEAVEGEGGDA